MNQTPVQSLQNPSTSVHALTRNQILLTAIICLITPLLLLVPSFPFHRNFVWCAVFSGCIHFFVFLIFEMISKNLSKVLIGLSIWNNIFLGFTIHYSGGIVSPFTFLFVSILISDAIYGIDYTLASLYPACTFLTVVILEYTGILHPVNLTSKQIYGSLFFMSFTTTAMLSLIIFAGLGIKKIMRNLRYTIELQHKQKEALQKELVKLEAPSQVGLLVNKIVHDIRGPLGAISGFIQMIQESSSLKSAEVEDCEIMLKEVSRISNLINRMIIYTKPGDINREPIDPVELLKTLLSVISFYSGANRIQFETDFPEGKTVTIVANKEELQQVYFNLLKNSIEALSSKPGSKVVKVKLVTDQSELKISIHDNGPGIPEFLIQNNSNGSISTKKEGAGLGLVIVKEILQAYGGKLELSNHPEGGACIITTLKLPA